MLKAVLLGKFIALNAYIKITMQINILVKQLKWLKKLEQSKHKPSQWQEVIRIRD